MTDTTGSGPVLIVLHQETSSPGRVGQVLRARGYDLDIRRPPLGDRLPDTLEAHSGAVVFGGPMSANDPDEYIRYETDWMDVPLKEGKPILGICLGAQMLVNHLGGEVKGRADELVEIGWYPLRPTEAGGQLMAWPEMIYQFHREGFSLPRGAELLATGDTYPNQAFRYGQNAWGIQFHAELTQAMMQRWVVRAAHRFTLPNSQDGAAHLKGRYLYDQPVFRWLNGFVDLVFGDGEEAHQPQAREVSAA